MPHLHGFTGTCSPDILIVTYVKRFMKYTVSQHRQIVPFNHQLFCDHQEFIGAGNWLLSGEILTDQTGDNPGPCILSTTGFLACRQADVPILPKLTVLLAHGKPVMRNGKPRKKGAKIKSGVDE